ncbi:MAG: RimK family alpha-L-glutamate ligase [Clostridia bacterium]|nr:RimK family alpha-L-glutamate ligase [Clostridia bacterium]
MAGYVIYNGFWNAVPPDPAARMVIAAAAHGVTLSVYPNTAFVMAMEPLSVTAPSGVVLSKADFVLFWDKDTRLAKALESVGVRVYNPAHAIEICDDKSETHRILAMAGIPQPETLLAPMTYREINAEVESFLEVGAKRLGFPLVVKECYGSFGDQVSLAHSMEELRKLAYAMESRPFMLQRFVSESAGEDVRLYVVGGRLVAAMRRRSDGKDFRANLRQGGSAVPYTPTPEEEALALRCCRELGLCFGGVDLLHTNQGAMVCEVNSNAHLAGIIACTGVDVADEIVSWVLEQEKKGKDI